MKLHSRHIAIALTLLIAGCGGGGSSTFVPSGNPQVNPTATPVGSVTPSPINSPGALNTARVTISAPPRTAGASAVAPITSIVAVIKSINGNASIPAGVAATTVVPVTASNCAGQNCTFSMSAPAGTISTVVTEYAGSTYVATGSFTYTSTGAADQAQTLALGAIVGNAAITAPALTLNEASTQPLTIVVTDPSGAVVNGSTPFANALTLNDDDSSGATGLQVGNVTSTFGASVPYNAATTVINLVYNGNGYGNITITATGPAAEIATTSGYKKAPYTGK